MAVKRGPLTGMEKRSRVRDSLSSRMEGWKRVNLLIGVRGC